LPAAATEAQLTEALRKCGVLGEVTVTHVAVEKSFSTVLSPDGAGDHRAMRCLSADLYIGKFINLLDNHGYERSVAPARAPLKKGGRSGRLFLFFVSKGLLAEVLLAVRTLERGAGSTGKLVAVGVGLPVAAAIAVAIVVVIV